MAAVTALKVNFALMANVRIAGPMASAATIRFAKTINVFEGVGPMKTVAPETFAKTTNASVAVEKMQLVLLGPSAKSANARRAVGTMINAVLVWHVASMVSASQWLLRAPAKNQFGLVTDSLVASPRAPAPRMVNVVAAVHRKLCSYSPQQMPDSIAQTPRAPRTTRSYTYGAGCARLETTWRATTMGTTSRATISV